MLSQARGEDSSGANFVHLYRGRRSISFRRWCFSSRRRFLFRLYLISSERRRLRRLLKWRSSSSSPLSSSLASISGGRERARGCSFVSKSQDAAPVQSGRPIQTVRLITASLSIVFIYIHPRFASFVRERKEPRLDVESVARMESARVSLGARVQACRGRFAEHC